MKTLEEIALETAFWESNSWVYNVFYIHRLMMGELARFEREPKARTIIEYRKSDAIEFNDESQTEFLLPTNESVFRFSSDWEHEKAIEKIIARDGLNKLKEKRALTLLKFLPEQKQPQIDADDFVFNDKKDLYVIKDPKNFGFIARRLAPTLISADNSSEEKKLAYEEYGMVIGNADNGSHIVRG